MKKQEVLLAVTNCASSIFSKEDVINLINSVEESNSNLEAIVKKLESLQESISYDVQNLSADEVVDYSSAEFSISCNNRLEIEDISLNVDRLNEIVENSIVNLIDELRGEEEIEEVVSSEYVPVEEN